jgi:hypothetical protein
LWSAGTEPTSRSTSVVSKGAAVVKIHQTNTFG